MLKWLDLPEKKKKLNEGTMLMIKHVFYTAVSGGREMDNTNLVLYHTDITHI